MDSAKTLEQIIAALLQNGQAPQKLTQEQMQALQGAGQNQFGWFSPGGTPTGTGEGWDGSFAANPTGNQFGVRINDDVGALYDAQGNFTGNDVLNKQTPTDLWKQGIAAALAMYGGAQFLQGYLPGAEAAMGGGLEAAGAYAGGGAVDAVGSALPELFTGSMPSLSFPGAASAFTPDILAAGAISGGVMPTGAGLAGLSGLGTLTSGGGSSFMDKAGNFLSDPNNLLRTIGTVGAIAEGFRNNDTSATQTTTKNFDPKVKETLFGTGGLLDKASAYVNQAAANNYTNPQMTLAKEKMTGLLSDPNVWNSLYSIGGQGVAMTKNPWLLKGG